jgi:cephalosporin-C deacetylase-like acetyl esterase
VQYIGYGGGRGLAHEADRRRTEEVLRTLDYFDIAGLVPAATAPALFSVALRAARDSSARPSWNG